MSVLELLVRRWQRRWALAVGLVTAAAAALTAALATRVLHLEPLAPALVIGGLVVVIAVRRRRPVDARTLARHLNRTLPAVEESADLLALPEADLSPLERLQRARVEARLARLAEPPKLPTRGLAVAAMWAGAAMLAAVAVLAWHPAVARATRENPTRPAIQPVGPPRILSLDLVVRPPAYTGHAARTMHEGDADVEQDGQVTWRLRTDRPVGGVFLLTTDGDTIPCSAAGTTAFEARAIPVHSMLYQVMLRDGGSLIASDIHRLTVIPDEPPTLTVVRPEARIEIAYGAPLVVPLEVLAGDDYAVLDAHIVATVTTGTGEAVKFREQTLAFDSVLRRKAEHGLLLHRSLDLRLLGLAPGDELYFSVVAHDNRAPRPNEGRSETHFIVLTDTAHVVMADLSGLAVNGVPEYLRSERQIIIDTERLLTDATHVDATEFRNRSESIGFDQGTLRDRYGDIAGQETVEQGSEVTIEHEHDTEENATLLSTRVKDKLQAAIGQMWGAERRLRTGDPGAALPYEYRALELLKAAQEAARVYVQRVGFEPPPLEPDRTRLTGKLNGIASSSASRTVNASPSMPEVRAALTIVQRLEQTGRAQATDMAALQSAGRELGALALQQTGRHLETLRDLRSLLTTIADSGGRACRDCLAPLERGLWGALPAPDPASTAGRSRAGVARTYFELLYGGQTR
jgi:hypothetical protein